MRRFESRFERWWPRPKGGWREDCGDADGAGLLYDLGSHLVDQALTLSGPVASVYCELDRRRGASMADDDVFLALTHVCRARSHLWMSAVAPVAGPRFRVSGSEGAYVTSGMDPQEDDLRAGRRPGDGSGPWGVVSAERRGLLRVDGAVEPVETAASRIRPTLGPLKRVAAESTAALGSRPL